MEGGRRKSPPGTGVGSGRGDGHPLGLPGPQPRELPAAWTLRASACSTLNPDLWLSKSLLFTAITRGHLPKDGLDVSGCQNLTFET